MAVVRWLVPAAVRWLMPAAVRWLRAGHGALPTSSRLHLGGGGTEVLGGDGEAVEAGGAGGLLLAGFGPGRLRLGEHPRGIDPGLRRDGQPARLPHPPPRLPPR